MLQYFFRNKWTHRTFQQNKRRQPKGESRNIMTTHVLQHEQAPTVRQSMNSTASIKIFAASTNQLKSEQVREGMLD